VFLQYLYNYLILEKIMKEPSHFERLAAINVNEHIEKKGGLSYLSWAWAVDQLLREDPDANWVYPEPNIYGGGTVMVFCTVRAFGKPMTAQLPVMDYKNRAVPDPDSFAMNTAMQRCLVKAIALTGIALYIYSGEDLPRDDTKTPEVKVEEEKTDKEFESFIKEHLPNLENAAKLGLAALQKAQKDIPKSPMKVKLWMDVADILKSTAKAADDSATEEEI
jgi:hypothetical protein